MTDDGSIMINFEEEERRILSELSALLPKPGDRAIQESPSAAFVDPLGLSDPVAPNERSPMGRWMLYSQGFLLAADRLVDSLSGVPIEDSLIYPIFHLYRHHLELELKGLTRFCLFRVRDGEPEAIQEGLDNLSNEHGLKKLWNGLRDLYPKCVGDMPTNAQAFEILISELDRWDLNSQASRYPWGKKGQQTFLGLRAIDLRILGSAVHKMSNFLGCVYECAAEDYDPDRDWA